MSEIKRVVVRGTNWVGDAVMTVPALRELRRLLPSAEITLATRAWSEGLFADADFLDKIIIVEAKGVFSQALQWTRQQFDLAVIFPNSFATALVPALARVRQRVGYATQKRNLLLTSAYPLPDWHESRHEVFYYLNIIANLEKELTGTTTSGQQQPDASLTLSDERKAGARNLLHGLGLRDEQVLVALCPGSINSRAKRWPAERFADLADRLIKGLDAQVILIGSSAEQDVSAEVERQMKLVPVTLTGKTSLSELVAVLSQADLLITNDTGPAHISAAVGTPTLVIFGPTNPVTTRPFSDVAEMLRQPPDCAPCMLRDCPIDHRCMTAIASDDVYRRAAAMLQQKPERVGSNELRAVGS